MNGYLVVARCPLDDIPLGLFNTLDCAMEFAKASTRESVLAPAKALALDTSLVYSVGILSFVNGLPHGGYRFVHDFEEDE